MFVRGNDDLIMSIVLLIFDIVSLYYLHELCSIVHITWFLCCQDGGGKFVYTVHEDNAEFTSPSSQGPAGETEKIGIRDRLRKFLTRRPTSESLEKQGILQGKSIS